MSTRAQHTNGPHAVTPEPVTPDQDIRNHDTRDRAGADRVADPRASGANTPGPASSVVDDAGHGSSKREDRYGDANHTIDADEDNWAWRAKIRANPTTRLIYRAVIGIGGLAIVVLGVVLLPAPGPGWLIIFAGLGLWSTEFEWAQRLLDFARSHVRRWTKWLGTQPLWVKALVGVGCLALVLAAFYLMFLLTGIPTWIPSFAQDFLRSLPGIS